MLAINRRWITWSNWSALDNEMSKNLNFCSHYESSRVLSYKLVPSLSFKVVGKKEKTRSCD